MNWLGIDIGGANLKAANAAGWARSVPFALWRNPHGLAAALATFVESAPAASRLAMTMTGELCDCFCSKAEGVRHILAAVRDVAGPRDVRVYFADGRLVTLVEAFELLSSAAASNWHALAQFACRFAADGSGLLIDIGSTTTDIIPFVDGRVAARGRNDTERLATRELLYSGVGRTPICAVMRTLPWRGQLCPIAAEVFSTTADAYLLLGKMDEDLHANWTADGRPLTIDCARQRLARQLCADAIDFATTDIEHMARAVRDAQLIELTEWVEAVIDQMPARPGVVVLSGSGEFLARTAVENLLPECPTVSLADRLGPEISRCGPAYAVAVLADESV